MKTKRNSNLCEGKCFAQRKFNCILMKILYSYGVVCAPALNCLLFPLPPSIFNECSLNHSPYSRNCNNWFALILYLLFCIADTGYTLQACLNALLTDYKTCQYFKEKSLSQSDMPLPEIYFLQIWSFLNPIPLYSHMLDMTFA